MKLHFRLFSLKIMDRKYFQNKSVHLAAIAVPAPVALRPFAELYNPFSYGCSLLCNHPVDREAKDILKKARESWVRKVYKSFFIQSWDDYIITGKDYLIIDYSYLDKNVT